MKLQLSLQEAKKAVVSLHVVGLAGMLIPWTFPFFKSLTPYFLVLCFALLAYFHKPKLDVKTLLTFLSIGLMGFSVEALGVATGRVFGVYAYDQGLGFKLLNTPLLIAANWLFLVYATATLLQNLPIPSFLKVLFAAGMMTAYDLVLEQVAPRLGLWHFDHGAVPVQNYLAWFGLSLLFHTLLQRFRIRIHNPLASWLLVAQFLFFVALMIFLPQ